MSRLHPFVPDPVELMTFVAVGVMVAAPTPFWSAGSYLPSLSESWKVKIGLIPQPPPRAENEPKVVTKMTTKVYSAGGVARRSD